jgi:hypothetical protein
MPSMGSNAPDEAVTYPGGFGNLDTHVLANMVGSLKVSPPPQAWKDVEFFITRAEMDSTQGKVYIFFLYFIIDVFQTVVIF